MARPLSGSREASFRRSHPSSRPGPVRNGTAQARFRGSARARRGTTPRASSSLPAPKRVPAREHHSAAEAWDSRTDRYVVNTRTPPSQLGRRWSSQNAATEQLTMLQRRVLTAVTCIAAVNAFVAPSRSVARPSSSHAQPTAPAAMRQQTQQPVHESRHRGTSRIKRKPHAVDATPTGRRDDADSRVNVPAGN